MQISDHIPNLVGGITQQPPETRIKTACEEMVNAYPSAVQGLSKRRGAQFVASMSSAALGTTTFMHTIDRDAAEKYFAMVNSDGTVEVYDLAGNAQTITLSGLSQSYLTSTDPSTDIRAVTVGDYTFLTNRGVTVQTQATSEDRANPSLNQSVHVKTLSSGDQYVVTLGHDRVLANGDIESFYYTATSSTVYSYTSGANTYLVKAGQTTVVNASDIAADLATGLTATQVLVDADAVSFDWDLTSTSTTNNSLVEINSNQDFYIVEVRGPSSSEIRGASKKVVDFDDLPDRGSRGQVVHVTGQTDDPTDDYFVEWDGSRWTESVAHSERESLDPNTMPQVLIRASDGTWSCTPHTWAGRLVGSADSNETPSFVTQEINDIFLFQGRLGVTAGESIVMSEVDYLEQFYRSTCVQLEDDNRIDVQLNFGRVEIPHSALAVQDELIIFTDKGQFTLSANGTSLTPKTVSAKQIGDFETSPNVRPHAIGKSAFFTTELGGYTQAREFFLGEAADDRLLSSDLTIQCPQFVTGDARYIQASRDHKAVFVLNRADPGTIWIYKFEYDGQEKVQSAWCRWDLGIGDIESIGLYQNYLYCVSSLGTERELTKIDIRDQPDLIGTELMRLDMQVVPTTTYYANGVSGTGDPETRLDLPFDGTDLVVVWDLSSGYTIPVDRYTSGGNLFIKGDYSAADVIVGIPYDMSVKLSTIYRRAPKKPEGEIVVTDGRLVVNYLNIAYTSSATFQVEVSSRGRSTKTYYAGPRAGYVDMTFGELPKDSGYLRVPVMTRNDNAQIYIKNVSPFGSTVLHVDWFGKHIPHAKRV
jgi:hypothetical protein